MSAVASMEPEKTLIPKVYRAMKVDSADGLPVVGTTNSSQLGIREGEVTLESGIIVTDGKGMSVAPSWRELDGKRIPKRLRNLVPAATGANNTACFMLGEQGFHRAEMAVGLELVPDEVERGPIIHGVIAPLAPVSFDQYLNDLVQTRAAWQIDES